MKKHESKSLDIEQIFVKYANKVLKDDPKGIYSILDEVERHFPINSRARGIYELIAKVAGQDYPPTVESDILYKHLNAESIQFIEDVIFSIKSKKEGRIWLNRNIFGHKAEDCDQCIYWEWKKKAYGEKQITKTDIMKCYECNQIYFGFVLSEIIKGKEYTLIDKFFETFCDNAPKTIYQIGVKDTSKGGPFEEELEIYTGYYPMDELTLHQNFEVYLFDVAKYSLIHFLYFNDRRLLKKCPYCHEFYTAKKINRETRCYEPDCERVYQRDKKRKQREEEPEIYRY